MLDTVYVERADTIATVVLNRPEKLNALDLASWAKVGELVRQLDSDDDLRCIVFRGVDARAFAAGSDIAGFAEHRTTPPQVREYGETIEATLSAIGQCRHPTVAAIRGVCVGGGMEISSVCDIRICGTSSRFGAPINRLGLTMSHAELRPLINVVGATGALDILLEGGVFGAERARELGFVTRVVADDAVEDEANATARRIADGAPLVNRWHKKFIRRLADPTPLTQEEVDEAFDAFDTEDYRIGCRAFLDKTKPVFEGR
jgi:enoyl-CoA hydratase/carnithine racemase